MKRQIEETTQEQDIYKRTNPFAARFADSRASLYFIARRVLHCNSDAEAAVNECFKAVSLNPPVFASDGAFRSWLLRRVIDEALLIFERKQSRA